MAIFFSPSKMGFYDDVMKADYETANSWPADLTPVSERWYQSLIKGQSEGKVITLNEYGYPFFPTRNHRRKNSWLGKLRAKNRS